MKQSKNGRQLKEKQSCDLHICLILTFRNVSNIGKHANFSKIFISITPSPQPFEKLLDPCLKSGYTLSHVVRGKCTHQMYNIFFFYFRIFKCTRTCIAKKLYLWKFQKGRVSPPPHPPAACDSLLHDDSKFCVEEEQKLRGEILQDRVRLILLEVCK